MLTLKQYVEMRLARTLEELRRVKREYQRWEDAATAIENGKDPDHFIELAYSNWHGMQPKEPPRA